MDDFSTPDQANGYGLPPSKPNFIRPFKKPQSSMSPIIVVTTDGRLRAVVGASGGPRIISALIQTLFRSNSDEPQLASAAYVIFCRLGSPSKSLQCIFDMEGAGSEGRSS